MSAIPVLCSIVSLVQQLWMLEPEVRAVGPLGWFSFGFVCAQVLCAVVLLGLLLPPLLVEVRKLAIEARRSAEARRFSDANAMNLVFALVGGGVLVLGGLASLLSSAAALLLVSVGLLLLACSACEELIVDDGRLHKLTWTGFVSMSAAHAVVREHTRVLIRPNGPLKRLILAIEGPEAAGKKLLVKVHSPESAQEVRELVAYAGHSAPPPAFVYA